MSNVKVYSASTLGDIFNAISSIKKSVTGPLWYRGHENADFKLNPNQFRAYAVRSNTDPSIRYNYNNLFEQNNLQHFVSRTHDLLDDDPENTLGWLELSQHYGGRTRLMDWSESAIVSIKFACLSYYLDKPSFWKNGNFTPCIWVLDPYSLNKAGYELLRQEEMIANASEEFGTSPKIASLVKSMKADLDINKENYFFLENASFMPHMNKYGIPSLSIIESLIALSGEELYQGLCNHEINPYHYLLMRYYSKGLPIIIKDKSGIVLPPLASLQPYHSDRIRAQRGVFTICPNYELDNCFFTEAAQKDSANVKKVGDLVNFYDPRPMENQPLCCNYIYRIDLYNPRKIKDELETLGETLGALYPSIESYNTERISGK